MFHVFFIQKEDELHSGQTFQSQQQHTSKCASKRPHTPDASLDQQAERQRPQGFQETTAHQTHKNHEYALTDIHLKMFGHLQRKNAVFLQNSL